MVVSGWGGEQRELREESSGPVRDLKAGLIEQLGRGDVQRPGDTQNVRQGDVALAPLHRADVGAMNTDLGGKGLLGNTGGPPPLPDHETQLFLCVINVSSHISNCSYG